MATKQSFLLSLWNSPTGPKTVHFWGPVANWGLVGAAMMDMNKPPELISLNMTAVLAVYSLFFMRFAWMVVPRNYLMLATHVCNETAQLYQLQRKLRYEWSDEGKAAAARALVDQTAAAAPKLQ